MSIKKHSKSQCYIIRVLCSQAFVRPVYIALATAVRIFSEPYFSKGRGWTYTPTEQNISLSKDGETAFFDELLLNENYGQCRGSGMLRLTAKGWKIAQYNLSIPLPNALAKDVVATIAEHKKSTKHEK